MPRGSVPAQRCTAKTSSGKPCKRWAIVGGNVCPTHGGSAPQVREAARRRILSTVERNLVTAQAMIDDPKIPAGVRARLLVDMLDRAGLKAADVHALVAADTVAPDLDAAMRDALEARGLLPVAEDGDQGGDDDEGDLP